MTFRLLDKQISLIEYLTNASALFGGQVNVPADSALQGLDPRLLRLEARFICSKRIKKVIAAFPRTCEVLGAEQGRILRTFVETNPPTDMSSLTTAFEFYDFLLARWQRDPPKPPYLPDIATCEVSMVKVCNMAEETSLGGPRPGIRRSRNVALLRCAYDIGPLFETPSGNIVPAAREALFAVTQPARSCSATIRELPPVAFELLVRLDEWTDPRMLGAIDDLENWANRLVAQNLIEVRVR